MLITLGYVVVDIVDDSGLRLTLTPTLRQHDAGVLTTGVGVNDLQIVPPFEKEFLSSGFCTSECLNKVTNSQSFPCRYLPTIKKRGHWLLIKKIENNEVFSETNTFNWQSCYFLLYLSKGLGNNTGGVNIIAILEHGHLLARKIRTRIIRNGTELDPLAVDNNYDFNFQEFRNPPNARKIMSVSIYSQYPCFSFVLTKTFDIFFYIYYLCTGT